jgi:hypothetical protein
MDLSTNPREHRVEVEPKGERHLVDYSAPRSTPSYQAYRLGHCIRSSVWPPRHARRVRIIGGRINAVLVPAQARNPQQASK